MTDVLSGLDQRLAGQAAREPARAGEFYALAKRVVEARDSIAMHGLEAHVRIQVDEFARAIAAEPVELDWVTKQLDALERGIAVGKARVAAVRAEPAATDPRIAGMMSLIGRPTGSRSPIELQASFKRAIDELLENARGFSRMCLDGLRFACGRPLGELDLQRIALLVERQILRAPSEPIDQPRFELGGFEPLRLAGNESVDQRLLRLVERAGIALPPRPVPNYAYRTQRRDQLAAELTDARYAGDDEHKLKAIVGRCDEELRAFGAREANADRTWQADVSRALARVDVALALVATDDSVPMVARVAADHVRRHMRGAPTHRWELDEAITELVDRIDLAAAATPPADVAERVIGMVAVVAAGIEHRSRGGHVFTRVPIAVEVDEATWAIIEGDAALSAMRTGVGRPSEEELHKRVAELDAERARLHAERARLQALHERKAAELAARRKAAAAARKSDNPARPRRLEPSETIAAAPSGEEFGGEGGETSSP